MKKEKAFDHLTKKERRLLNLEPESSPFRNSTERMAAEMTKGMDKKKLERELKQMERMEWEG